MKGQLKIAFDKQFTFFGILNGLEQELKSVLYGLGYTGKRDGVENCCSFKIKDNLDKDLSKIDLKTITQPIFELRKIILCSM